MHDRSGYRTDHPYNAAGSEWVGRRRAVLEIRLFFKGTGAEGATDAR
jgi:hypothetical protein